MITIDFCLDPRKEVYVRIREEEGWRRRGKRDPSYNESQYLTTFSGCGLLRQDKRKGLKIYTPFKEVSEIYVCEDSTKAIWGICKTQLRLDKRIVENNNMFYELSEYKDFKKPTPFVSIRIKIININPILPLMDVSFIRYVDRQNSNDQIEPPRVGLILNGWWVKQRKYTKGKSSDLVDMARKLTEFNFPFKWLEDQRNDIYKVNEEGTMGESSKLHRPPKKVLHNVYELTGGILFIPKPYDIYKEYSAAIEITPL